MNRYLVVGLGHFGSWVARALYAQGHDVVAIERVGELVDRHADGVTRAVRGDASSVAVLREAGAVGADAAVISTGEDLATAILASQAARDLGIPRIYVKVGSPEAARALETLGVTETIFPEREVADRLAKRIVSTTVLDYVPLTPGFSIQEIAIPDEWVGQSLKQLALPRRHGIQVVALHDVLSGRTTVALDPERVLTESDIAIVAGADETIKALLKRPGGA